MGFEKETLSPQLAILCLRSFSLSEASYTSFKSISHVLTADCASVKAASANVFAALASVKVFLASEVSSGVAVSSNESNTC